MLNREMTNLTDLYSLDDASGMDCRILAEQERGLIFSGGVGYVTIFDVVSNMEVTHVQI